MLEGGTYVTASAWIGAPSFCFAHFSATKSILSAFDRFQALAIRSRSHSLLKWTKLGREPCYSVSIVGERRLTPPTLPEIKRPLGLPRTWRAVSQCSDETIDCLPLKTKRKKILPSADVISRSQLVWRHNRSPMRACINTHREGWNPTEDFGQ